MCELFSSIFFWICLRPRVDVSDDTSEESDVKSVHPGISGRSDPSMCAVRSPSCGAFVLLRLCGTISAQSRVTLSSSREGTAAGWAIFCGLSVITTVLCCVGCCLLERLVCGGPLFRLSGFGRTSVGLKPMSAAARSAAALLRRVGLFRVGWFFDKVLFLFVGVAVRSVEVGVVRALDGVVDVGGVSMGLLGEV